MKTTKMSLANIQGKLSRTEMKNIMAGSDGLCGPACDAIGCRVLCNNHWVDGSCQKQSPPFNGCRCTAAC